MLTSGKEFYEKLYYHFIFYFLRNLVLFIDFLRKK